MIYYSASGKVPRLWSDVQDEGVARGRGEAVVCFVLFECFVIVLCMVCCLVFCVVCCLVDFFGTGDLPRPRYGFGLKLFKGMMPYYGRG